MENLTEIKTKEATCQVGKKAKTFNITATAKLTQEQIISLCQAQLGIAASGIIRKALGDATSDTLKEGAEYQGKSRGIDIDVVIGSEYVSSPSSATKVKEELNDLRFAMIPEMVLLKYSPEKIALKLKLTLQEVNTIISAMSKA